jgi:hypothetical protein
VLVLKIVLSIEYVVSSPREDKKELSLQDSFVNFGLYQIPDTNKKVLGGYPKDNLLTVLVS